MWCLSLGENVRHMSNYSPYFMQMNLSLLWIHANKVKRIKFYSDVSWDCNRQDISEHMVVESCDYVEGVMTYLHWPVIVCQTKLQARSILRCLLQPADMVFSLSFPPCVKNNASVKIYLRECHSLMAKTYLKKLADFHIKKPQ